MAEVTSRKLETRTLKVKFVSVVSPVGVERTLTLYEGDEIRGNDIAFEITMLARPEAPSLQRPTAEKVTFFKVNVFYHGIIESTVDVDIDPTLEKSKFA